MKPLTKAILISLSLYIVGCTNSSTALKEISNEEISEFIELINNKDSATLKLRLPGFDLNAFDSIGVNLLTYAVMSGEYNIVKLIGDNGADPNLANKTTTGSTPLMMASQYEDLQIAKYLLALGADIDQQDSNGDPAIHWSAYSGNIPYTKLMLESGAQTDLKSIHSDGVLQVALKEWQYDVVNLLLEYDITINEVNSSDTELIKAVRTNNLAGVKSLVNNKNVNARDGAGNALLMIAARQGFSDITEYLVNAGAEIDAMNSTGHTALNLAVYFGSNDIAGYLIDHKADIVKTDSRFILPPLVAAVRSNNRSMGKILLAHGARVNETDGTNNFTPIMWAALYANMDFVELLMDYNPDLSIISKYETTVFDLTQDDEILALLNSE